MSITRDEYIHFLMACGQSGFDAEQMADRWVERDRESDIKFAGLQGEEEENAAVFLSVIMPFAEAKALVLKQRRCSPNFARDLVAHGISTDEKGLQWLESVAETAKRDRAVTG